MFTPVEYTLTLSLITSEQGVKKILENSRNWAEFLGLNQAKCMHMSEDKTCSSVIIQYKQGEENNSNMLPFNIQDKNKTRKSQYQHN
jgi:hypothetical protein